MQASRMRLSLLALIGVALPLAVGASTISGTVTGPDGVTPVLGASAYACYVDGSVANSDTTDASGAYAIDGLPAGTYRVVFHGSNGDHLSEWYDDAADLASATDVVVPEETTVTGIDASLAAASKISGMVTGPDGVTPLPGMLEYAYRWDGSEWEWMGQAETDATGHYTLGGLPAGTYRVALGLFMGDYVFEWYDDAPRRVFATDIVVPAATTVTGIDASLALASAISGTVTGGDGIAPLEGIRVYACIWDGATWIYWASAYTDASGNYTIAGLSAGTYRVQFEDWQNGGFITEVYDNAADLASGTDVVVPAVATVTGIDASLTSVLPPISGTVTGPDGITPLQGIRAKSLKWDGSWWNETRSTQTDASGHYAIDGLSAGTYRVQFEAPNGDYLTEWYDNAPNLDSGTDIVVPGATSGIDASLAAAASISGRVTGPDGTTPLQDIEVDAYVWSGSSWQSVRQTWTDASGDYTLGELPANTYRVQFHGGATYLTEWYDNASDLYSGTDIVVSGATTDIDASLALDCKISGTLTGPDGTTPLLGVQATAYHWNGSSWDYAGAVTTDASGNYTVGGLPAGTYRVQFDDWQNGDYLSEVYDNAPDLESGADIVVSGTTSGIDASLATASKISGTVTGPDGITPLPGIQVAAYGWNGSSWDYKVGSYSASGHYSLGRLPAGTYRVQFYVSNPDYISEWYNDAPSVDSGTDVVVPAATSVTDIDVSLATASKISGTVTGSDGTTPLPDVWVYAYSWNGSSWTTMGWASTDASGVYTIGGLSAGTYRVQFTDYSYDYFSEAYDDAQGLNAGTDIVVPAATTVADIDASLAKASKISGTVTGPDGTTPLPGIYAYAYSWNGSSWDSMGSASTDASGHYAIGGLTAGTYRVQFADYSYDYFSETYDGAPDLDAGTDIVVPAGTTVTDIDASLAAASRISGTVTGPDGVTPLEGIQATAYTWNGTSWDGAGSGNTDASGHYSIDRLPAGTYRVQFTDYEYTYFSEVYGNAPNLDAGTDIVVPGATSNIDASLAADCKVSGTVTGPDGTTPLQGIQATAYNWNGSSWDWVNAGTTDASGAYAIGGLTAGVYRVQFDDWQDGDYLSEAYDNAPDLNSGTDLVLSGTTTGIDASLALASRISGTLTGPDGTTPLPDVWADAYTWSGSSWDYKMGACTDASGAYTVGRLPAGTYRIRFIDYGGTYLSEVYDNAPDLDSGTDIVVPAAATVSGIDASLTLASKISGTLTGPDEVTPLPGVWAYAYTWNGSSWNSVGSTYTDADGVYTLGRLPAGTYRVTFIDYAGDYLAEVYDNAPDLDSGTDIVVPAATTVPGIDASLAAASKISGTVTGPDGTTPLLEIEVSAYSWNGSSWDYRRSANTDASGHYTIGGLTGGTYRVQFYGGVNHLSEAYDNAPDLDSGADIVVPAATTVTGIDASLATAPNSEISGTVTGTDGVTPLQGIQVTVYTWNGASWDELGADSTDASGHYAIGRLAAGTYRAQFTDVLNGDYFSEAYNDAPDLDSGTDIVVPATATVTGIDASLTLASKISGTVTGPDGTTPLQGLSVAAYRWDGESSWYGMGWADTDASGHYSIGGLPAGTYRVRFDGGVNHIAEWYDNAPDFASGTDIAVPAETNVPGIDASLALAPTYEISGTVTGPDGITPLPGIWANVYRWNGSTWDNVNAVPTDETGNYTVGGLPAGTYRVWFDAVFNSDYLSEWYDNAPDLNSAADIVVPGETTGIDASLASAAPPEPPAIVGLQRTGADVWEILLTGTTGAQYILQEATSPTGAWGDVGETFVCLSGTNAVSRGQAAPVMFWRLRVVP